MIQPYCIALFLFNLFHLDYTQLNFPVIIEDFKLLFSVKFQKNYWKLNFCRLQLVVESQHPSGDISTSKMYKIGGREKTAALEFSMSREGSEKTRGNLKLRMTSYGGISGVKIIAKLYRNRNQNLDVSFILSTWFWIIFISLYTISRKYQT